MPPIGTKVRFTLTTDSKTGRTRADNVEPADAAGVGGRACGVVSSFNGKFGFVKQDNGEPDMFVLPPCPPVGARVSYDIITDPKTGRPRAENIVEVGGGAASRSQQDMSLAMGAPYQRAYSAPAYSAPAPASTPAVAPGKMTGTMGKMHPSGTFGFIQQDQGEADMFCLPPFHDIGTRVAYDIIADPKTGRPRAENVEPIGSSGPPRQQYAPVRQSAPMTVPAIRSSPYGGGAPRPSPVAASGGAGTFDAGYAAGYAAAQQALAALGVDPSAIAPGATPAQPQYARSGELETQW